jgi:DNA-binding phage protein
LDRLDVNGDYTSVNCRWGLVEEQQNNRRNSRKITAFGETLSLAQWARKTGLSRTQIRHRIETMGMAPEEALTAERMSWVQHRVQRTSADGSEQVIFDSVADAAKATGVRRESLWAHLKRQNHPLFSGYSWAYVSSDQ